MTFFKYIFTSFFLSLAVCSRASPTLTMCSKQNQAIGSTCPIVCHVRDVTNNIIIYKNGVKKILCSSGFCSHSGITLNFRANTATLVLGPLAYSDEAEYTCSENGVKVKGNLVVLSKIKESDLTCLSSDQDVVSVGDFCLTSDSKSQMQVVLGIEYAELLVAPSFITTSVISCTAPENAYSVTIQNPICPDHVQGHTNFSIVVELGVELQCSFLYTCEGKRLHELKKNVTCG